MNDTVEYSIVCDMCVCVFDVFKSSSAGIAIASKVWHRSLSLIQVRLQWPAENLSVSGCESHARATYEMVVVC